MSETPGAIRFPTTQWSRIARLRGPDGSEPRNALEALCGDYWFPLYAMVRRRGHSSHDSEELVQGFFVDLLERGDLLALDRAKGRFRSFLRAACDHYLANQRDREQAQKRGGGRRVVTIDRLVAEGRYDREPAHHASPERLFERQWALTVLARVLERLEAESTRGGRSALFERLRPALQGDDLAETPGAIGEALGMTEGAVRVAAHRLRVRYRELLREEVARTTDDPADVDAEIADLLTALAAD